MNQIQAGVLVLFGIWNIARDVAPAGNGSGGCCEGQGYPTTETDLRYAICECRNGKYECRHQSSCERRPTLRCPVNPTGKACTDGVAACTGAESLSSLKPAPKCAEIQDGDVADDGSVDAPSDSSADAPIDGSDGGTVSDAATDG